VRWKIISVNPRSSAVKKSSSHAAALAEVVSDEDDMVLQFDGTDTGKRLVEAWKRARIIVETGGGHGATSPIPLPQPPPRA